MKIVNTLLQYFTLDSHFSIAIGINSDRTNIQNNRILSKSYSNWKDLTLAR